MVRVGRGDSRGDRPRDRIVDRTDRFPAGRRVSHHLHPRARGLDVDVPLSRDGVLERAGAGLQHAAVGDDGAGARAHGRADDAHRDLDWLALGTSDLGDLLGLGCADDVRTDPALPLSWRHRAPQLDRRPAPRRPRLRGSLDRRCDQRADHLLFSQMVEHAAPGRVGAPR